VHVRFIAVGDEASHTLGNAITKATNTQNRINRQDFVSLDPEQQRLRTELSIEGIIYNYKTGEVTIRDPKTCDIDEATVALACASPDLGHSTQAKREIGKLWEDTSKAPYKALFNPSVSGMRMWHCIQIMRSIDRALQDKLKVITGRDSGFLVHGNRCTAHLTFQKLPMSIVNASSSLPSDIDALVSKYLDEVYEELTAQANALYPQAYLAQLFKNQKKLSEIKRGITGSHAGL
jgi:AIPR protein